MDFDGSYNKKISIEYSKLIEIMWKGTSDIIIPLNFFEICAKYIHLILHQQYDSHEFLTSLLYYLSDELNRIEEHINNKEKMVQKEDESLEIASKRCWDFWKSKEDSIITDLFEGQEIQLLKCKKCNATRNRFESFFHLSLPINNLVQFIFLTSNLECIDISMKKSEKLQIKDMINKIFNYIEDKNLKREKKQKKENKKK